MALFDDLVSPTTALEEPSTGGMFSDLTQPEIPTPKTPFLTGGMFDDLAEAEEDRGFGAFASEFGKGLVSMTLRTGRAVLGTGETLIKAHPILKKLYSTETPQYDFATGRWEKKTGFEVIGEAKERIALTEDKFPMTHRGTAAWAGRVLGEAIPFMGAALAAGYAIGPVAGPMMVGFTIEGDVAYEEAKKKGASEATAQFERFVVGTINGALEAWQISKIMKFHTTGRHTLQNLVRLARSKAFKLMAKEGLGFTGDILKIVVQEAVQEFLQEGVSITVPALTRGDVPRTPDGQVDFLAIGERLGQAALGGGLVGGVFAGGGAVFATIPSAARPTDASIDSSLTRIQESNLHPGEKARLSKQLELLRVEPEAITPTEPAPIVEGKVEPFFGYQPLPVTPIEAREATKALTKSKIEQLDENVKKCPRCTNATLEAFGIRPSKPVILGIGVRDEFQKNGFILKPITPGVNIKEGTTVGEFIKDNPEGGFYIMTANHAMALIDGKLTDFAEGTGRRKVVGAFEILAKPTPTPEISVEDKRAAIAHLRSLADTERAVGNIEAGERLDREAAELFEEIEKPIVPKTDLDKSIEKLGQAINEMEEVRPIEAEQISKELGKRFGDFAEILQGEPDPIIAQRIARSALAGALKMQITPFIEGTFTREETLPLYDSIRNATMLEGEKISAFDGLNKLIFGVPEGRGSIPARHEIAALQEIFGKDIAESLIKKRKQFGESKWQTAMDVINVPRAILASYDMSAPLRQGLLMLPLAPKQWIKSVGHAYRAFASPQYSDFVDIQIRTHPYFERLQKSGLFQSRPGSLTAGEEYWRGQMGEKIPYLGVGIRASERAYTTFLNNVRAQTFYKFCEQWEGTGKTAQDYRDLAGFLNHATGRGDPKWLAKHIDIFNIAFFAPRLLVGRVQVIGDLFTSTSPVRKIIAADLLEGIGAGLLILTLVSMIKGVDVEKNPLSTDFGKIRFGNTRIDFWGGYQQIARYTIQFLAGMRKTTQTKRIVKVPRGDILWRFVQSKLSPPAGFALDMATGETFLGRKLRLEPAIVGREAFERFVPLFVQDVIDAARFQGMSGLAMVVPTALHGVGAMTYPITATGEEIQAKNALSQHYFGRQWDELGPTFQQAIENANPHINLMRERSRMERENWSFMERIGEQEAEAARKILKGLPRFVQDELDRYIVRITGLSRIISGDWSLNDERYEQYQERTAFILNKALPKVILNANYRNLSFQNKRLVLDSIIDIAKRAAREEIVRKANINDLISNEQIQRKLYRRTK